MLRLSNVNAGYAKGRVLHNISLAVNSGEVVCLVGRNGAGKTSIMRSIIQDQCTVTEGSIKFDSIELRGKSPYQITRLGVALVPEDRRIFPSLTVRENLSIPKTKGSVNDQVWTLDRVYKLFPTLKELGSRPGGVLSGGEQQMLSMARSLLLNPKLLMLDEPHEGLAPLVAHAVVDTVKRLKQEGVSMLISEQALLMMHECADRVYVVDRGQIVFSGTQQDLASNPHITERYLMAV